MTDIELVDGIMEWLDYPALCPADVTTTVTTVGVQTFVFADTIGGLNDWVGGVLKITSGRAAGKFAVIIASETNSVTVATRFHRDRAPETGDTVLLTKGPLGEARTFLFEPSSLALDVSEDNIRYFVAVTPVSGDVALRGVAGRSTMSKANAVHSYSFEILAMTPHKTGGMTAADVRESRLALPILKEQIMVLMHGWRASDGYNAFNLGPIAFGYGPVDVPGLKTPYAGCLITFDISTV